MKPRWRFPPATERRRSADRAELPDLFAGTLHVVHLRQRRILEPRRVADERIGGSDTLDRRIEPREAIVRDPRGDLGAVAPRDRILVEHDRTVRLAHGLVHRVL